MPEQDKWKRLKQHLNFNLANEATTGNAVGRLEGC